MNYITGTHLSRRTFLRGAGVAMALPLLDAMSPAAFARKSRSKTPTRMSFVYLPNGAIMDEWTPKESKPTELTGTLSALNPHFADLNVLTGLAQMNGLALGDGPGDHARAAATFLTGVHPKKTAGADIQLAISADQVAAEFIGHETRLPSLELTLESARLAGNCDSGYSCAYTNSISWRTDHTPNPHMGAPREVFNRLFGVFDADATPDERTRQRLYRKSVLDWVADDTKSLMRKLGKTDREKMDEYLYAVRKLEQRVESNERYEDLPDVQLMSMPDEEPEGFVSYARIMFDLQVLAFKTDQTRIITMMVGREGSTRVYDELEIKEAHHELTHHQGDKAKVEQVRQINAHHIEQCAYFLEQLKAVDEEGDSLLDRSMIVFGSGISDGNRHSHNNLPVILAGKGNGTIKTGRHLEYPDKTPLNNLFISMLDRMGAPTDQLGDSTGTLEQLSKLT